ncbi:ABC transporter substrate-binding protein [Pseudonocardia sichuanensis]
MDVTARARALVATLAVACLALAGCASSEEAAGGPVTLEFWAWGSNIDKRVEVWNQSHPDVQVAISAPASGSDFPVRVLTAVRAGEGPDIAQAEYTQLPTYVSAGVLADVESVRPDMEAAYAPEVLETVTFDGTIFGIPQDLGPSMFIYRKDLFAQHGLAVPTTWDEFRTLAEQVRALPGSPYLVNFSNVDADLFMGLALQAGAQWWEYSGGAWSVEIDDEPTNRVLDFWRGLVEDDLVSTFQTSSPQQVEATASGQVLAQLAGAWAPGPLLNQYPDTVGKWAGAQIPQWDPSAPRSFARGGSANLVLQDTEHHDEAVEFLMWLNASDEGAEGLVQVNKFTGALHGQQIDRDPPALMPGDTSYWPTAVESASHLVPAQWGPNTQVAFTALTDRLGSAFESGSWSEVLPTVEQVVRDDLT